MYMRPALSYIPCDTSSWWKTGYMIMLAQFEEGWFIIRNLEPFSVTRDDTERVNESYDN